jgi:DNA-binding transcriptional LysR family regulator
MNVLRAMHLFVSIVDKGSLTAASEGSSLTPTMVGNHLRALEEHLGMKLLNRTTRQQHLTVFGTQYYSRCVEILGLVNEAQAVAVSARAEPQGRLRVTISQAFGQQRLMPALKDYLERYPKVELDVIFTDRLVDLLEEGFEAAIRIGELPDSNLIAQPLRPHALAICASPAYLSSRGRPDHPEQLPEHDCLTYLYTSKSTEPDSVYVWKLHGNDGEHLIKVNGRVQMDNGAALRQAALADMGIALLPVVMVEQDLIEGRLIQLFAEYQLAQRPLHLLYLADRRGSPKLRSFIQFMLERFG